MSTIYFEVSRVRVGTIKKERRPNLDVKHATSPYYNSTNIKAAEVLSMNDY